MVFKRKLSLLQWVSLVLLFFGCLIKELDNIYKRGSSSAAVGGSFVNFYILVILLQVMCSCLAGVYTEYLLKKQGEEISVHLQNVFMYIDSILCNGVFLLLLGKWDALTQDELAKIVTQPRVLAIVFNGAAGGLMTAFLLKYLNSIMKMFANSFEIFLVAVVGVFVLGIPISNMCVLAMFIVCGSLALYWYGGSRNAPPANSGVAQQVNSSSSPNKV